MATATQPPANPREPVLLTPGPLTTSAGVKSAMQRDFASRDAAFVHKTAALRQGLREIVNGGPEHDVVPLSGSGTSAVEAMLTSLVPRDGNVLVLENGAYGRRMTEICHAAGREVTRLSWPETAPVEPAQVARALARDARVTHVACVHCETTTGLLNPLDDIARAVARQGRSLLVDAVSSLGALPLDLGATPVLALAGSANKCLEGVPGLGFCIARREALAAAAGNAPSLTLDLAAQWRQFETDGQWRFTPPTHAVAACLRALAELDAEGGPSGRLQRYRDNLATLVEGMRALGFVPLLPPEHQAPVIVTFRLPPEPGLTFGALADGLARRGFVIYPGKLAGMESFRVGCIGRIDRRDIEAFLAALAQVRHDPGPAPDGLRATDRGGSDGQLTARKVGT